MSETTSEPTPDRALQIMQAYKTRLEEQQVQLEASGVKLKAANEQFKTNQTRINAQLEVIKGFLQQYSEVSK